MTPTKELLQMALLGLQQQKQQIETKMAELRKLIAPGRKKMSLAGRKRIAAVQRDRWAKFHAEKGR